MASFQQITVPENFYTKTSDMLLVQPEPQYLYGQFWLGAMAVSLATPGDIALAGRDPITGTGGAYSSAERDRLMLASPILNQVIAAKVDFSGMPGSTVRLNRPVFANTTYTEASRRIVSGSTISQTGITIGSQQTNLSLYAYGGPYDSTNSRIAPYAIEAFDASLGVHNAVQMHGTQIVRDCHKFIDAVQVTLLDLASTAIYPEGMSAVNDATTAGSFPMTFEQITRVQSSMNSSNLPTFPDGFRALVITPGQLQNLQMDESFQRAGAYFPQYNALFPGYVKSVCQFHVFVNTTLTTTANSSSVNIDYGHAIAPGALLGGMSGAPGRRLRVTPNTNDNYGNTSLVIWQGDLAFGLANNSLVVSVRSSQ
jgi:hypothetical protein